MKNNKLNRNELLLFAGGLFVIGVSQLIAHCFNIPDTLQGAMMGIGIAMEIGALVMIKRNRSHTY